MLSNLTLLAMYVSAKPQRGLGSGKLHAAQLLVKNTPTLVAKKLPVNVRTDSNCSRSLQPRGS